MGKSIVRAGARVGFLALSVVSVMACSKVDPQKLEGNWVVVRREAQISGDKGDRKETEEMKETSPSADVYHFSNHTLSLFSKTRHAQKSSGAKEADSKVRVANYQIEGNDLVLIGSKGKSHLIIDELTETDLKLTVPVRDSSERGERRFYFKRLKSEVSSDSWQGRDRSHRRG